MHRMRSKVTCRRNKGESKICRNTMKESLLAVIILGLVLANSVAIAGASPDLTETGKDWLAMHAGSGTPKCYQTSGIPFTDTDGLPQEGSTGDVAGMLYIAHFEGKDDMAITGDGYSYNDFKAANENNDLTEPDIKWVFDNEGGEGEPQYCIGVTPTPTPTPTPTSTPTLTGAGKDWLATYAGVDNCFKTSGISYKDADGVSHTGARPAMLQTHYLLPI